MTPAIIPTPIVTNPQSDAETAAQGLANVTRETAFVVEMERRYFIGSSTVLAVYHSAALTSGLARIVATVDPIEAAHVPH